MPKQTAVPSAADRELHRAATALQMGHPGEAERIASHVLKSNRSHVGAATILAQALMLQNRLADAVEPLQRAARRGGDSKVETLLATALRSVGRTQEALDLLHAATARRPPFPPAFAEYANQLAAAGSHEKAVAALEEGLSLAPAEAELSLQLAALHLGANRRSEARAVLERARALSPGRPDVAAALARIILLDGDYGAAIDLFRQALGLRPDDALTRADLAACLLEFDQRDAAEAALRAAMKGRPEMLGRALHALCKASHGRFFLRPSAAKAFFDDDVRNLKP
jgi:tetratricopeptide (TPR) repeat protein